LKRQNVLKLLFLSLILSSASSCGLIEKWKTPEQPTDSKTSETSAPETDDLFSKTMNETSEETALNAGTDAPSNVTNENANVQDDLKSLEDEFSGNAAKTTAANDIQEVKVEESLPEIKEEVLPAITDNTNMDAGKVMSYKVQKGETLMQIAFKIYGDVSKWKSIKQMNSAKLSNHGPRAGMELNYTAPEKNFVWNPEGNPHMIRTGETLGTISNTVYQTPKKWKDIWENNKPLIKNPNVIYAGFTLYYKSNSGLANYVQPKAVQKKMAAKKEMAQPELAQPAIEDVKVEQAIANQEQVEAQQEAEIDLTENVSAPIRGVSQEVKAEDLKDEWQEAKN